MDGQDHRGGTVREIRCQVGPYLEIPVAHDRRRSRRVSAVAARPRSLRALVLHESGSPARSSACCFGVGGEHTVRDRGALVERDPGQPRGDCITHVIEMRCLTTDDHAQRDDGVVRGGQRLRHHRELDRARAPGRRVVSATPAFAARLRAPATSASQISVVPRAGDDRQRHVWPRRAVAGRERPSPPLIAAPPNSPGITSS